MSVLLFFLVTMKTVFSEELKQCLCMAHWPKYIVLNAVVNISLTSVSLN